MGPSGPVTRLPLHFFLSLYNILPSIREYKHPYPLVILSLVNKEVFNNKGNV
jgi:hypothetical protein